MVHVTHDHFNRNADLHTCTTITGITCTFANMGKLFTFSTDSMMILFQMIISLCLTPPQRNGLLVQPEPAKPVDGTRIDLFMLGAMASLLVRCAYHMQCSLATEKCIVSIGYY